MLSTCVRKSESKMDEALTPQRRTSKGRSGPAPWNVRLALLIFVVIVTGGLLAFGAVDRAVQIPLVVLLGVGLLLQPPRLMQLPPWMNRVMIALVVILVLKELLPASWFGIPAWRTSVMKDFGVQLPATHHPEPGRALDGWLAGALALLWFSWVRALATERVDRMKAAWALVFAATLVAVASFCLSGIARDSIFGLRYTPDWFGFGPFPNRNHTGSLFAMAIILGIGCVAHAGARKRFDLMFTGVFAICVIMAGLLRTQSRGALLALAVGFAVFCIGMVAKAQSRKAVAIALAIALLLGGAALVAGEKTLGRLKATAIQGVPDDSARARLSIWRDALKMSKDAPVLGYGLGAFQGIFPFYQDLEAEDVTVKHPESSVLQAFVEIGGLPLLMLSLIGIAFVVPHVRFAFQRRSSFFLAIGGFGAAVVLLAHAWIDVPAHRWGTAGFALAALAIACPASVDAPAGSRRAALVPLGIAGFWMLPIFANGPAWAPFQLDRVLSAGAMNPPAYGREIHAAIRWFPLNPKLRLLHANYLEIIAANPALWQNEYRIAARLLPSSWKICAQIAQHCQLVSPSLALHYWQMAVERASLHRVEAFQNALRETANLPGADGAWQSYVDIHSDLLLTYAEARADTSGREHFDLWWERRGSKPEPVSTEEAEGFLRVAERWASPDQIATWARLPGRLKTGSHRLVEFLKGKQAFKQAWEIASVEFKEPEYPPDLPTMSRDALRKRWLESPSDVVNARNYAQVLDYQGDHEGAEQVIARTAETTNAPRWFVEKAAYQLARRNRHEDAVRFALQLLPP
jgi:O-antigen ligase